MEMLNKRLEEAMRQTFEMPVEEILDILDAYKEGRLLIWPRVGEDVWFHARGICRNCFDAGDEACPNCGEDPWEVNGRGFVCPETWRGDDMQKMLYAGGELWRTKEEAMAAVREGEQV